jgi:hypothetical protein
MWSTQYTDDTELPPQTVWMAVRDIHTGATPNPGGDVFEIHGPFQLGTELSVTPQGQDTFRSEIIELVENERYADRTQYGDITLTFRTTLVALDRGTRVTHELVIAGPAADEIGPELGPQISEDFPATMQSLFDVGAKIQASTSG